ncbi:MAG: hypothetical protein M3044_13745, partial [Thermoproteota archaeon]|nr:hypothetical protein [Thermoproteota archaeon]
AEQFSPLALATSLYGLHIYSVFYETGFYFLPVRHIQISMIQPLYQEYRYLKMYSYYIMIRIFIPSFFNSKETV